MLQAATVASGTLGLLGRLQAEPLLCSTRLVGGTALSLQIGHRVSDDLDLFSVAPLDGMAVQRMLVDKYGFVPTINSGKRPKDFVDIAFLSMHFSYNDIKRLLLRRYPAYDPMMADRAVVYFGDIDETLIPEINMIGYEFDFGRIKNRIIKMTDNPDKVYTMAPFKQR